jgi:hypothetical protein
MDNRVDSELKAYFSQRVPVPPALRATVRERLCEAETREIMGRQGAFFMACGVVAYTLLVSFAILLVLWTLLGPGLIVYFTAAFAVHSMFAVVALSLAGFRLGKDKEGRTV